MEVKGSRRKDEREENGKVKRWEFSEKDRMGLGGKGGGWKKKDMWGECRNAGFGEG